MTINARHVKDGSLIYVNGKRANGNLEFKSGENIEITLENIPDPELFSTNTKQGGLFSNDFIFYTAKNKEAAQQIRNSNNPNHLTQSLTNAIREGNISRTRNLLNQGANPNKKEITEALH